MSFVLPNITLQEPALWKSMLDYFAALAARQSLIYAPHEQDTPNMTVRLEPGCIPPSVEVAAQSTETIVPPTTHPRIDLVIIDNSSGAVDVVMGTEAVSPVAPDLPTGKSRIAEIALATSTTVITNSLITDRRALGLLGFGEAALLDLGTTTGTVCAGDDARVTNAILADLRGITFAQGDLLYFDGENLAKLAAGTSGQFLKTLGAGQNPAWANSEGGEFSYSGTKQTFSAVASVSFTGLDTTTYDYMLLFRDVAAATAGANLKAVLGTGSGPTWITTTNYMYVCADMAPGDTALTFVRQSADSSMSVSPAIASGNLYNGRLILIENLSQTYKPNLFEVHGQAYKDFTTAMLKRDGWGVAIDPSVVQTTALKITASSGNISGTIELWRRAKK